VTVLELELDGSLALQIERDPPDRFAYTVVHDGEAVLTYDSSADPRTEAAHVALRNVVRRNVEGYEKSAVSDLLADAIDEHEDAIAEELGPRPGGN